MIEYVESLPRDYGTRRELGEFLSSGREACHVVTDDPRRYYQRARYHVARDGLPILVSMRGGEVYLAKV